MYLKQNLPAGPPKITSVIHCNNDDLKREPDVKLGYKMKSLWSTLENDMRFKGDDRLYDRIIKQSEAQEADVILRKKKLQEYFLKPKRGTERCKIPPKEGNLLIYGAQDSLKKKVTHRYNDYVAAHQQTLHTN